MKNLALILRLMQRIAPGLDAEAIAEEIRDARSSEELDYELEASNQRALAAHLPRPPVHRRARRRHRAVAREHVLVTEFVDGAGFEESRRPTRTTRDRVGEIVFRFYFGSLYRHRQFSGDPHPGNFLLLADGRVAFLDFGLFKRMPDERRARARVPARRPPRATRRARCTS